MLKYIHLSISLSHKFFMNLFAVPNLLEKAITATHSSLDSQLQILQERVSVLTAAAESCVRTPGKPETEEFFAIQDVKKEAEGEEGTGEPTELHKISRQQVQIVLDGLATARQLEVYLRCLSYITGPTGINVVIFVFPALKYIKQTIINSPNPNSWYLV